MNLLRLAAPAVFLLAPLTTASLPAQNGQAVPVRHRQGTAHAFVVIRSESKAVLGYGEILQLSHGERINSRTTFHFRDGSLDDETTVFTQGATFHFISDHHIQRGPFFSKATDALVEENGNVTVRTVDKDGKEKVEQSHIDLPPDTANGLTGTTLLNTIPTTPPFKLSMVAPTGKGRLIQLSIDVVGKQPFSPVLGVRREATVFRIHPELGGVAGVVAPIVGKQPKDIFVWILEGEVPGLVREIGQLAEGGPVVSIEPAGAAYPPAAQVKK